MRKSFGQHYRSYKKGNPKPPGTGGGRGGAGRDSEPRFRGAASGQYLGGSDTQARF